MKIKFARAWKDRFVHYTPLWYDRSIFTVLKRFPFKSRILDLGSGTKRIRDDAVSLDVHRYPNVDIVADGQCLPFRDEAFDCVFCNAVLEHVPYPFKVAEEICRVLKKEGYACIQAPFLEPTHKPPNDYFRFTLSGLRVLFKGLKEVKSGISAGPSQTITELIRQFVPLFFYDSCFYYPAYYLISFLVFPIRFLDPFLRRKNVPPGLDRAYYLIGQKMTQSDLDVQEVKNVFISCHK